MLTQVAFSALLLIGGFSIARVNEEFAVLGPLAELRYWLIGLLIIAVAARGALRKHEKRATRNVQLFVLAISAVHFALVLSALWAHPAEHPGFPYLDLFASACIAPLASALYQQSAKQGLETLLASALALGLLLLAAEVVVRARGGADLSALGAGGIGVARTHGVAILSACYFALAHRFWILLCSIPFFASAALMSGSRAGAFAIIVSTGVWLLLTRGTMRAHRIPYHASILCLIAAAALAIQSSQLTDFMSTLWEAPSQAIGTTDALYLAERDEIFTEAIGLFSENVAAGLGFGTYVVGIGGFVGRSEGESYPHNLLLSLAVDAGLLALVPAGAAALLLLVSVRPTTNLMSATAFAGMTHAGILSMFSGSYYDARLIIAFAISTLVLTGGPSNVTLRPTKPSPS